MTDKINNFFNSWNFTTVNRIKFLFTFIMTIIGLLISFYYGLAFGGCITAAFVCYNIYKIFTKIGGLWMIKRKKSI